MTRRGDAFAMVHLGEKYNFELNGNTSNPDYDSKTDYPSAAKQSFKQALAAGNIRSAGIISELYQRQRETASRRPRRENQRRAEFIEEKGRLIRR